MIFLYYISLCTPLPHLYLSLPSVTPFLCMCSLWSYVLGSLFLTDYLYLYLLNHCTHPAGGSPILKGNIPIEISLPFSFFWFIFRLPPASSYPHVYGWDPPNVSVIYQVIIYRYIPISSLMLRLVGPIQTTLSWDPRGIGVIIVNRCYSALL